MIQQRHYPSRLYTPNVCSLLIVTCIYNLVACLAAVHLLGFGVALVLFDLFILFLLDVTFKITNSLRQWKVIVLFRGGLRRRLFVLLLACSLAFSTLAGLSSHQLAVLLSVLILCLDKFVQPDKKLLVLFVLFFLIHFFTVP